MRAQLRLYKNHDKDLIMLLSYGVSFKKILRAVLRAYVDGKRIRIQLPDCHVFDLDDVDVVRFNITFPDKSAEAKLFRQLKPRCINQFCKALIRDALDTVPLGVYFYNRSAVHMENDRIQIQEFETVQLAELQSSRKKKTKSAKQEKKQKTKPEKHEEKAPQQPANMAPDAAEPEKVEKETNLGQAPSGELLSLFDSMLSGF